MVRYLMPSVIKSHAYYSMINNLKITVDMLACYSKSHYSTIVYILQHCIKIVNQGRAM